ncbi:hypothetical protein NC653_030408 [Populus alba x Populus x berolinensis]|uniref:Uncharacterized protein n=1 Tax=Populus alba x Populus x berolinensis TaxID=444605 RepID=A0AAD6LW01_9ROSI|nr:hypothetical protein NC653_030408 [Populus alba x Populus x berolinensis]
MFVFFEFVQFIGLRDCLPRQLMLLVALKILGFFSQPRPCSRSPRAGTLTLESSSTKVDSSGALLEARIAAELGASGGDTNTYVPFRIESLSR